MPETVTESLICNVCDTEIRDGSVFCYNCGETVSDTQIEEDIVPEINDVPVSDSELKEAAIDNDMRAAFEEADEIERDTEELSVKAKPDKLRSAASLRKRARAYKRRPAEFVLGQTLRSLAGIYCCNTCSDNFYRRSSFSGIYP